MAASSVAFPIRPKSPASRQSHFSQLVLFSGIGVPFLCASLPGDEQQTVDDLTPFG
jgi:hypothetical protein